MKAWIRNNGKRFLIVTIFLIGFSMSCYPFVASWFMAHDQSQIVGTYASDSKALSKEDKEQMIKEAQQYNSLLYQIKGAIAGDSEKILSHENYEKLLDISNNKIMATLEIPKINVDLPVYHGTDDKELSIGVGHMEGTSLPVGGNNTHSVLTGHRGLPSAKLFTRLDELNKGDLFFVNVLDQTLAYQIEEIQVVEPDEVDSIEIQPDQDLMSLVTCTPYGINTHRMIVTGHRVEYNEKDKQEIKQAIPSIRELLFILIPIGFMGILIVLIRSERKEKKCEAKKDTV